MKYKIENFECSFVLQNCNYRFVQTCGQTNNGITWSNIIILNSDNNNSLVHHEYIEIGKSEFSEAIILFMNNLKQKNNA